MKKSLVYTMLAMVLVLVCAPFAMASSEAPAGVVDYTKAIVIGCSLLAAGIAIAFGTIGTCLLYTSDAADDLLCVDLGGRRIIENKT